MARGCLCEICALERHTRRTERLDEPLAICVLVAERRGGRSRATTSWTGDGQTRGADRRFCGVIGATPAGANTVSPRMEAVTVGGSDPTSPAVTTPDSCSLTWFGYTSTYLRQQGGPFYGPPSRCVERQTLRVCLGEQSRPWLQRLVFRSRHRRGLVRLVPRQLVALQRH
jgi:hypothetical protein